MSRTKQIFWWSAVTLLLVVVVGIGVIRFSIGWFSVIPQNGMYPSMPAGSWLFSVKKPYRDISQVPRGDVVIFDRIEGGKSFHFIWRVVGLPGETIEIAGDKLIINGQEVTREMLRTDGNFQIYRETNGNASYDVAYTSQRPTIIPGSLKVTIANDQLFVMGDNRHNALDSRSFGPIQFASITGKKW